MGLFIVGIGVVLLLLLMVVLKFNGFISLILVSLVVGFLEGMPLHNITASIYKGIGSQLNSLILILAFGAMQASCRFRGCPAYCDDIYQ